MIFIPEIEVYNLIGEVTSFIRSDFALSDSDSIFRRAFDGIKIGDYEYKKQGIELFGRGINKPDMVGYSLFFQPTKVAIPHIHITLPSESSGEAQGLGLDVGYRDLFSTTVIQNEGEEDESSFTENREVFTRSYTSTFNLVVTGRTSEEILLLYHIYKHALLSIADYLMVSGFQNLVIGGADLQMKSETTPMTFFRAITLTFFYETSIPERLGKRLIEKLQFQGRAKNL